MLKHAPFLLCAPGGEPIQGPWWVRLAVIIKFVSMFPPNPRAPSLHPVKQSTGDLLDEQQLHLSHHTRREGLRNEMARRVHVQNARTDRAGIAEFGWHVATLIGRK